MKGTADIWFPGVRVVLVCPVKMTLVISISIDSGRNALQLWSVNQPFLFKIHLPYSSCGLVGFFFYLLLQSSMKPACSTQLRANLYRSQKMLVVISVTVKLNLLCIDIYILWQQSDHEKDVTYLSCRNVKGTNITEIRNIVSWVALQEENLLVFILFFFKKVIII